jgi:hypothetical protein
MIHIVHYLSTRAFTLSADTSRLSPDSHMLNTALAQEQDHQSSIWPFSRIIGVTECWTKYRIHPGSAQKMFYAQKESGQGPVSAARS